MIMLVGDDSTLRTLVEGALGAPERRVIGFHTPTHALPWLHDWEVELVICDCKGEGPRSVEPFRELIRVSASRSIPFLLITSWRDILFEDEDSLFAGSGSYAVLLRPLDPSLFLHEASLLIAGCSSAPAHPTRAVLPSTDRPSSHRSGGAAAR